jgi:hypothetical protein
MIMAFILEATKWKESSRLFLRFPSTSGEVAEDEEDDVEVVMALFLSGLVALGFVEVEAVLPALLCFVYEIFPYSLKHGQIVSKKEQKSLLIPNHPVSYQFKKKEKKKMNISITKNREYSHLTHISSSRSEGKPNQYDKSQKERTTDGKVTHLSS